MAKKDKHADYVHPSLAGIADGQTASDKKPKAYKTKPTAEAIVASDIMRSGEMKLVFYMGPATISVEIRVP